MPTVALVSRKGGCGKSTLATNIAAYFARTGLPITLGDLDHQQSMRVWLKRRPSAAPTIAGWVGDMQSSVRPPLGVSHLVLDTPGGLHGLALAKVAMVADVILIPVAGSVFDRESASDCWAELRTLPRVLNGRCHVAAVGMRLDRRTDAEEITSAWASSIGLTWLGSLRSSQVYVRAVENGLSIFDMPPNVTGMDIEQWQPVLDWLRQHGFVQSTADEVPAAMQGSPSRLGGMSNVRILPRVKNPAIASPAEAPAAASRGFARFVPRFLRPRG
ncbi:MAG: ParA family protein [Burkholderiales bacterium]|nr:ParA family protein [Burkholderiales bacterium]